MKEYLINYETAALAKDKGFTDYTEMQYTVNGDVCSSESVLGSRVGLYPILTQSLLQKWLRDTHKICISIKARCNHGVIFYKILILDVEEESTISESFDNYEKALEVGLKEALELII